MKRPKFFCLWYAMKVPMVKHSQCDDCRDIELKLKNRTFGKNNITRR